MAFLNPIDPATPTDADLATGDDEFRQLKAALIERVNSYFNDIDEDPWTVRDDQQIKEISFGLLAARPNPPAAEGLIYFATDTVELFVSTTGAPDPEWTEIPLGATLATGLANELPNPPETDFFWATDTNAFYIREGTEWTLINTEVVATRRFARYYPDNVSGSRVMNLQDVGITYLQITDFTIPSPYDYFTIVIPWTELADLEIDIADVLGFVQSGFTMLGPLDEPFYFGVTAKLANSALSGTSRYDTPPFDAIDIHGKESSEFDITAVSELATFTIGIIVATAP